MLLHDIATRKQAKAEDGDPGKPTQEPKEKKAKKLHLGALIVHSHIIRLPRTWPEGEQPLCEAELRDGSKQGCKNRGKGCTKNHAKPKEWSKDLFTMMINWEKDKDNDNWNPNVMTPELMKCKYIKSADEVD